MNKFEQLFEYVINDETAKARELFHDIVVEKSRQIYEEMMDEEVVEEAKKEEEEELEEAKHEEGEEEELEEAAEEEVEESMEETMGGDQADDLIDDIEVEEEGMAVEGEDGGEDLEDRVVDLEDKLDELMAEFEALMGDEGADMGGEEEVGADIEMDMDTPDMDAEEVADDELETEGMMEAVNLKAAPAPVKSEEAGINKKSTVAANSGAKGAVAKPVNMDAGGDEKGRTAPGTKDLIGDVQNTPAKASVKQAPATKPHLAQATGVNTKSPLPRQ